MIRNPVAFGPSLLAMFGDALLPSAPTSTLPTSSLIISTRYSCQSWYRVVMKLSCMQQGISHQTCHRTTFALGWIFPMHSVAYTEIMCWKVDEAVPELYNFCHLTYSHHSAPQFGKFSIHLAGFFFDLAIHPLFRLTYPPLTMGFMDDISLGGPRPTVSSDPDLFRKKVVKIGFQLNVGKCKIISKAPFNPLLASPHYVRQTPFSWALHWLIMVQLQITPSKPSVQTYVQPSLDLKLFPHSMR